MKTIWKRKKENMSQQFSLAHKSTLNLLEALETWLNLVTEIGIRFILIADQKPSKRNL